MAITTIHGGYQIRAGTITQDRLNLATPVGANDAATKSYVDASITGLDIKASVRAASTANVTISAPGTTIDGVTLASGDRVLLKNQTTASQNGIYVFNGSGVAMTRATDADSAIELTTGAFTFVEEGTANAATGWSLTTAEPITLGTTSLTFSQFNAGTAYTAGSGLTLTGASFSVNWAAPLGVSAPADTNTAGTAVTSSRSDHKHSRESWIFGEVPSGTVNGANGTFTLAHAPGQTNGVQFFVNGILMSNPGDYTISSSTITMNASAIPQTGDILSSHYWW